MEVVPLKASRPLRSSSPKGAEAVTKEVIGLTSKLFYTSHLCFYFKLRLLYNTRAQRRLTDWLFVAHLRCVPRQRNRPRTRAIPQFRAMRHPLGRIITSICHIFDIIFYARFLCLNLDELWRHWLRMVLTAKHISIEKKCLSLKSLKMSVVQTLLTQNVHIFHLRPVQVLKSF